MAELPSLLPVEDALRHILASAPVPLEAETVALATAYGRTLAAALGARRTQPPADVSAMDGYALQAADISSLPRGLGVIGTSAAGHGFRGIVGPGEAVRIFTGAPIPAGADTVLIQENTRREGDRVIVLEGETKGRNIRAAGLDFKQGEILLALGRRMGASELALAAAMNHAEVTVTRKARVALIATGDELVMPGENPGPDQIVASNTFAVAAYAQAAGAEVIDLGIAADTYAALEAAIRAARAAKADILVTVGGASVGDHDLVQSALAREGMELGFWRIAMRPGKPLMHGRLGDMRILGLPGNPVSAIVCAVLFLVPLIRALAGDSQAGRDPTEAALLGVPLGPNDGRRDYLRATIIAGGEGLPVAMPFPQQDSSMLRVLAAAQCLVLREIRAPAAKAGDSCRIIRLAGLGS
jgi:molybdopterin molybdotransferase